MGARIFIAAPSTLMPQGIERLPVTVADVKDAVKDADAVMTLRLQSERMDGGIIPSVAEYSGFYGISGELLRLASKDAVVLHPGPINRGVEITSDVADGEKSLINRQVNNGLAVRMALLYLLTRRNNNE
jgi:aspartate carbamoyltransferase catalytic subunit